MNSFSLENKVIMVTGGTGILGQAFIKAIAEAGGTVAVLGRNQKVAEERVAELKATGAKAIALIADVTKEDELKEARKQLLDTYGRIDGLVNGAGGNMPAAVVQPKDDIFSLNMEGLRQVMDLNLFGTLLPTQVFGEAMAGNETGSIINISSMASQQAVTKVLGYSLAKAAIDLYTKWFAVELANRYGDKLRMNAIAPGFFLTEQNRTLLTNTDGSYTERGNLVIANTPYKRFGDPQELVGALIWLLSDASKFVTGTVVNVDGGFSVFSGV
ncbi:SDR family oxidoreductase [Mucilaginibacter sp. RS28]|uniref:SDR family oxidoreductase n=1 Tax=Mucilaginibacter straminoryzae TaxID=2932774 RepID=A0A9X1X1G8_9SPHI|nr:SDR family oxidoreductase [Mucilaginibacter straminoryzae]MCJ8208610.1 SDR family oxidoreductase [Mucilaginibacter straminoryzae]